MSAEPPPIDSETRARLLAEQNVDLCCKAANVVAKRLNSNWRSNDLLGFTWAPLLEAARRWDARIPFRKYAMQIIGYRIIDQVRAWDGSRRHSNGRVFQLPGHYDLDRDFYGRPLDREPGDGELLDRCLHRLPKKMARVMGLIYLSHFSQAEVAAIIGVSKSRVSQIHSQAIQRLRSLVADGVIR